MAQLLLQENGTVTIAHSRTKDLKEVAKRADILAVSYTHLPIRSKTIEKL